ncbi:MAG: alkaline phosphatase family protein, partial [Thermoanaerobaculia bacterium]|nr:alkaline phosphatase family protein [Thermoanaerobaculia bacterium]
MQPDLRSPRSVALAAATCAVLTAVITLAGCGGAGDARAPRRNVIILGYDGLDYDLTAKLMAEGRLPNFSRLAQSTPLQKLGTSVPPQSPVAWSNFITGTDAGGHGIFDFVHRDPKTMVPFLSTSRVIADPDAGEPWTLGKCQIPVDGGEMELLRHGTPFWEKLEQAGVETTVMRMPANFPPTGTATRELSGMGTPDILGTYGTFTYYTSELFYDDSKISGGGEVVEAWPEDGIVSTELTGPDNPFTKEKTKAKAPFQVHLDPDEPVAKLVVGDEERILKVGEWSDWVPVALDLGTCGKLMMTPSIPAIVRFYLKSVKPEFQLYASPLNIDPKDPVMPISTPPDFASDLSDAIGSRFYTQGMPEDTKAFEGGVLDPTEFIHQVTFAYDEMVAEYKHLLAGWKGGLLFLYFGAADLTQHTMMDTLDPTHPGWDPEVSPKFADAIPDVYARFDGFLGYVLEHMPQDSLVVVMSDHGFTSWRRAFALNTWLWQNGFLKVTDPQAALSAKLFGAVDWSGTRAYGLGINGLYVNLQGREKDGVVSESQRLQLMRELKEKLLAEIDPKTGKPAITQVFLREETYADGGYRDVGPDLVIGYAKGTRGSSASALGEFEKEVFADNTEEWPGDHLMDPEAVPGILLTNRPLARPAATLIDQCRP